MTQLKLFPFCSVQTFNYLSWSVLWNENIIHDEILSMPLLCNLHIISSILSTLCLNVILQFNMLDGSTSCFSRMSSFGFSNLGSYPKKICLLPAKRAATTLAGIFNKRILNLRENGNWMNIHHEARNSHSTFRWNNRSDDPSQWSYPFQGSFCTPSVHLRQHSWAEWNLQFALVAFLLEFSIFLLCHLQIIRYDVTPLMRCL